MRRAADIRRIQKSGEFDREFYASQLSDPWTGDLVEHYVRAGETLGLRPSVEFDPIKYRRNSADLANFQRNLFAHYVTFGRREGRSAGDEPASAPRSAADRAAADETLIEFIRQCGYFDPAYYARESGVRLTGRQLVLHYLEVGEQQGFRPSAQFDPDFYASAYPDVAKSGTGLLEHYAKNGFAEGRSAQSVGASLEIDWDIFDASLPLVVVLLHEASRTGAPILGWNIAGEILGRRRYNVLTVSKRGGVIEHALQQNSHCAVVFPKNHWAGESDGFALGQRIGDRFPAVVVIANSVETRDLAVGLRCAGHAVVALIHEFAAYSKPRGSLRRLYEVADELVFPAEIVRDSSLAEYPFLGHRTSRVLAQGPSAVPGSGKGEAPSSAVPVTLRSALFTVIGMGFVDWRKGCDVFISVAAALRSLAPGLAFKFIWYGAGFEDADHINAGVYLKEQIRRSDLSAVVEFRAPVADVEALYASADVLLMSSRLDPLPNVTIDAVLRGLPVVCFDRASGMAELFQQDSALRVLVAPYLDAGAAAGILQRLATEMQWANALRDQLSAWAQKRFVMQDYVDTLLKWGLAHSVSARSLPSKVARLEQLLQKSSSTRASRRALGYELASAEHVEQSELPLLGYYGQRLWPGFNHLRYAAETRATRSAKAHPLLHYLEQDCPRGPWQLEVIDLRKGAKASATVPVARGLTKAVHLHVHYVDLMPEFRAHLAQLPDDVHLIVTTDAQSKVRPLQEAMAALPHKKSLHAWSNLGRDVRPFLNVYKSYGASFDVIGHLHTKKSLAVDGTQAFGDRWRTFLLEGLIGSNGRMASRIFQAFEGNAKLGLVFPEDVNLIGWEKNLPAARELLTRMGLEGLTLPNAIDFPVGTMFWARTAALEPLLRLRLSSNEYPPEPLPYDGTLLHAFERLLPILAQSAGFECAVTRTGTERG